MKRTVISIAAILSIAGIIGFYIWISHNRYYIILGNHGIAYEVDKKTGRTWMLQGGQKILQSEKKHYKEKELPPIELLKISGKADLKKIFGRN